MENWKRFFSSLMFGLMAVCAMTLSACGDDDEDDNGGGGSASSVNNPLVSEGGKLLSSVSRYYGNSSYPSTYSIYYDGKLRPYRMCDDYDELYVIDFDNGLMSIWEGDEGSWSVKFNSNGYITKINGSWEYEYDGENNYCLMEWSASYDNDGHLKSVTSVYEEQEGDYYEKGTFNNALNWSNGNLVSVNGNGKWYDANGKETGHINNTMTFAYGSQLNKYKQYPGIMNDPLTYCGLYGKGSNMLPVSMTEESKEVSGSESYEDNYNRTSTYTLNEDGSINTEIWKDESNDNTIKFVFDYSDAKSVANGITRSGISSTIMSTTDKAKRIRNFMHNLPFFPKRRSGK